MSCYSQASSSIAKNPNQQRPDNILWVINLLYKYGFIDIFNDFRNASSSLDGRKMIPSQLDIPILGFSFNKTPETSDGEFFDNFAQNSNSRAFDALGHTLRRCFERLQLFA